MPLYEYQCLKCGKVFEKMQKFSDAPLTEHEDCGGPVERLLSAPGLQFKGSGWYITDYARSGGGKTETKPSETAKAPESKPASTTDTKPSTPSTSSS